MAKRGKREKEKMRFLKVLTLNLVATGFFSSQVQAGGYEVFGLGAKAMGMGGAFVGLADDWTATFWNPAGLAQMQGKTEYGIDTYSFNVTWYDRNSLNNRDPEDMSFFKQDVFFRVHPSEPTRFQEPRSHGKSMFTPSGGGFFPLGDYVMGWNYFVPNAYGIQWDDSLEDEVTSARIFADYMNLFYMNANNLCLARWVTPNLAIGGGVDVIYSKSEMDTDKTYLGAIDPALDYKFDLRSHASGWGIQGIFGALYKFSEKLQVGAVYRTGATIYWKGRAKAELKFYETKVEAFDDVSDFDQEFPLPPTWGFGIAYKPTPKLTFTADYQGTDWSVMKVDVDYRTSGDYLIDTHRGLDWSTSNRYRFGMEYKPTKAWALRCGVWRDTNPTPDKGIAYTSTLGYNIVGVTAGFGYERGPWRFDLGYMTVWGRNNVDGGSQGDRPINDDPYELFIGLSYRY